MDTNETQNNNQLNMTPSNTLIASTITETIQNDPLRSLVYNNINNNQNINEEKNNATGNNGRWEHSEHIRFLGGCLQFGNNWKKVETYVKTRTSTQIRSHAQKYLNKLQKKYFNNNSFSFSNLNNSKHLENRTNNFNNNEEINNINSNNGNENLGGIIEYNNSRDKIMDIQENDIKMNQRYKLNEEKLKQLLSDLTKPNFDIEIVEKIILKIFCFHKKYDNNFFNGDNNYNKSPTFKKFYRKNDIKNNNDIQGKKVNKNIFFCQKLKREPNYEKKIKEMLDSNEPKDLEKLFYIYQTGNAGKDDPSYKILMNHLENYD